MFENKKSIKIIIIILAIIFAIMTCLIFSDYVQKKKINENISNNVVKDWRIFKYEDYNELYVNDSSKEDGSNIYLLDSNNNLIYIIKDYNNSTSIYATFYDISATAKVIISKDKIKYNKDLSKDIKFLKTEATTTTTTTKTTTTTTVVRARIN